MTDERTLPFDSLEQAERALQLAAKAAHDASGEQRTRAIAAMKAAEEGVKQMRMIAEGRAARGRG
jgi:hypothetical protein